MPQITYFISDLHLSESCPNIIKGFQQFLFQIQGAEALYILGDFFEAWIGDDDDAQLNAIVANELKTLARTGTKIFLMHGNRDFLMGNVFAKSAGAVMLAEGTVISLYGHPTLLLHGDSLCTDDKEYVAYRQMVRSKQWQNQVLSQPLNVRRELAKTMRDKSKQMSSVKGDEITDVTPSEVIKTMTHANVKRMIHGHTHRPMRHSLKINDTLCERIVLGDWNEKGWAIKATAKTLDLISWDLT